MAEQGEYRCAGCGHGEHLSAAAVAFVTGPLLADGSVVEHGSEQDHTIAESIECSEHPVPGPFSHLERWIDGAWCEWLPCSWTKPDGHWEPTVCVHGKQHRYGKPTGSNCPSCDGAGGAWTPLAQIPTETEEPAS